MGDLRTSREIRGHRRGRPLRLLRRVRAQPAAGLPDAHRDPAAAAGPAGGGAAGRRRARLHGQSAQPSPCQLPATPGARRPERARRRSAPRGARRVRQPRPPRSKAPPCERILRRVYPTLRVHPLTSSIKEALVQKFKQRIPFSKWGDKTGKQGITYWELFRALSGYNHKKNEHHLVLIKGGFVRDIVQGKSLDEIHDVDVVHTKPFGQARFGNNGLGVLKVKYTPISDAESKYYYMKIDPLGFLLITIF